MKYLFLSLFLIINCGPPQFNPWQSNPKHKNLTAKHLAKLEPTNQDSFKVLITGDTQVGPQHFNSIREIENLRGDIAFSVLLGDITDRGLVREWDWVGDIIKDFKEPFFAVVGNHDGLNNGEKIYQEMFGDLNYSFTHNGVKFIFWNNNGYEWDIDLDWLEKEVNSSTYSVILSHQSPNSGTLTIDEENRWFNLRSSGKIIASLHGHVHRFSYKEEEHDIEVPIYTVGRVTDANYGVIEIIFTEDRPVVKLSDCTPTCKEVE